MSRLDAFSACYADWKLVKSRKVVQIVLEVAMEDSDAAYKLLGGMPNPAAETWVGVAKLNKQPEPQERRRWSDLPLSQQAAIRCGEVAFREFCALDCEGVKALDTEMAANHVREFCGVGSRKDLDTNATAAAKWRELEGQYDLWCRSGQ